MFVKRKIILFVIFMVSFSGIAQAQPSNWQQASRISLSVSQITGIALNPMLVSATIGTYNYFNTPRDERGNLPYYNSPFFLVLCFTLVGFVFLASQPAILANLPAPISTFLEMNNKQIGLLVSTPIVFSIISQIAPPIASEIHEVLQPNSGFMLAAAVPLSWLSRFPLYVWNVIIHILLFFVFIAIWILNFSFDVLIFLCPFGWVKGLLGTARGAVYAFLAILTAIHPILAFLVTLPIIFISVKLCGLSVRRVAIGYVSIKDFLTRKKEVQIDEKGILAFSDAGIMIPKKCMGRLTEKDGNFIFSYKKYFYFQKEVTVDLAESVLKQDYFSSSVIVNNKTVCTLPLRYLKIPEQVQAYLKIEKMEDAGIKKGVKAVIAWIKGFFSSFSQKKVFA